jgi:hypothetical protein
MAYTQVPNRATGDTIPAADVNQLQDNIEALKGGAGATAPTTTIEDLAVGIQNAFTFYLGGDAYTGTGIIKLQLPFAITATSVVLGAGTAPTGSSLTYDLNYHATDPDSAATIFNTNPSISAASHTGNSSDLATTSLAKSGWIVVDCDAVGSTLPGTDVTISIRQD